LNSNFILTALALAGTIWFFTRPKATLNQTLQESARNTDLFDDGRFGDGFPFHE
jgi:hypothetical protein